MSSTSTMFYFFFNDTATTEIYTLSLHDALPIWWRFGALYAISVLGGAAAIQLFGNPGQAVGGASTAIYGLLGALAVFMVARRQDVRGILTLLAINIVISFLPGISLLGHLGGLAAGAAAAAVIVVLRRRLPLEVAALAVLGLVLLGV